MATATGKLSVEAKNELLNQLNNIQLHGTGAAQNIIAVRNTQGGNADTETFTFGSASDGAIDISSNIVMEIPDGQTIDEIRYYKISTYGEDDVINPISVTQTTFPYGGRVVITKLKVTLHD